MAGRRSPSGSSLVCKSLSPPLSLFGGGFVLPLNLIFVVLVELPDVLNVVQDQLCLGQAERQAKPILFVGLQTDHHIAFKLADVEQGCLL